MAEPPQLLDPRVDPLLPSPRLPHELINLILEHLNAIEYGSDECEMECETERRKTGRRIQQVGRAWREGGRRIAFSEFTYFPGHDEPVEFLLQQPTLIKEIRELSIVAPDEGVDDTVVWETVEVLALELIEKCSSRLDKLVLCIVKENAAFMSRLGSSAMAPTLRDLIIEPQVGSAKALGRFIQGLAGFTGLRILELVISAWPAWRHRQQLVQIQPLPAANRLPVERLILDHRGEGPPTMPIITGELLAAVLDTARTRNLTLYQPEHKAAGLAWLGAFDHLEVVYLASSPVAEPLTSQVRFFVEGIASLPALKKVHILAEPDEDLANRTDLAPSPISLGHLVMRMPPSINYYSLGGGVFFVDDIGLPTVALERASPPDVRLVLSLKLNGAQDARPVVLARRTNTNGVKLWSIVPEDTSVGGDKAHGA